MSEILNLVKELRERTGAGFVDCKKALIESNNQIENAIETLRKKGLSKVNKKLSRDAKEGVVCINNNENEAIIFQINTETDFAAKSEKFLNFIKEFTKFAINAKDIDELKLLKNNNNQSFNDIFNDQISKIGENIFLNKFEKIYKKENSKIYDYVHNSYEKNIGKIGCLLNIQANNFDDELNDICKNICMHIAALKPISIEISNLDPELINKEKLILKETINTNEKNENIIENILNGKIKKYYEEVVLNEQKYIIDNKTKIKDLIFNYSKKTKNDVKIIEYKLYVLGNL